MGTRISFAILFGSLIGLLPASAQVAVYTFSDPQIYVGAHWNPATNDPTLFVWLKTDYGLGDTNNVPPVTNNAIVKYWTNAVANPGCGRFLATDVNGGEWYRPTRRSATPQRPPAP